ncbi:MAG TPA: PHP domain-containing protein [Vicinamibacteria bacterium]|nr:PHP domain-containing protein [Vicinamibacteria bacterium]
MPSPPNDRLTIARALREVSRLLAVRGENPFRARAYERGARALEALSGDLGERIEGGTLTATPGIGKALAAEIATLHRTGRSPLLERLRSELPPGILELMRVPGLSVGRIATLHGALGIGSIADLRRACEQGQVQGVRGFGPATERRILEAVRTLGESPPRLLLHAAQAEADPLLDHLRSQPGVARAEAAGALRRGCETMDRVELAAAGEADAVREAIARWPRTATLGDPGAAGCDAELASGARVLVHLSSPADFDAAWHRATGSPAHVSKVLALPLTRPAPAGEAGIYLARGLPFIPPELREDEGEVEAALSGTLPDDLLQLHDLRGFVHCHTTYSDGRATIEQMARAAEALGAEYITITDHSPTASYAGGLGLDRLKAQWEEIERVQEQVKVRLLRGTESDILADGSLDYPDHVLERMEVVIASIHARHRMDARSMTERLTRALRHPLFKIWGHGLGRLLERRPPVDCDVPAVLDAVSESRAAVEINGDPHRLDLEPRWVREARRRGIRFVISTDAHSVGELQNARWGTTVARRGWVRRSEVLNTLPVERFRDAVRPGGAGGGP